MTTENASAGGEAQVPQQPKKKKRRLWLKVLLGLVVLLILLVALIPMIASTGAVRSLVVGKMNGIITGRVEIQDWSLAWFGGQSINGVKVFDEKNRLVLEVSKLQTPASLIALARGNYDFGKTEIQDMNLTQMEIGADGQTNYQRLFMPKAAPAAPAGAEKPTAAPAPVAPTAPPAPIAKVPMPAVKIDLSIKPLRGTIIAFGADGKQSAPAIEIRPESGIEVKVGDPSQPITDRVKLVLVVGGKSAGTITLDGSATVDMAASKIQAAQKLLIEQLDLGALSPLLTLAKLDGQMAGMVSGELSADIAAADRGTVKGRITGTDMAIGGAMLKGDVVRTSKLDMPVDLTLGAGQTLSGTVMVETDQGKLLVDTNLPLEALKRLEAGEAPGAAGLTKLTVDVPDLAVVLNALKNSVKLNEGVAVTGGALAMSANVTLSEKDVKVDLPLKIEGLKATQNGQKIGPLQAITLHLAATAVPNKGKLEPRDLLLDLASGFATAHAAGTTLETTQLTADCDLSKVKAELGQVFDLSMIRGGTIHVALVNSGSLEEGQTLQPKLAVEARGISLDLSTEKAGERYVVENLGLTLAAAPTIQGKAVTIAEASPLTVMLMGRVTHVDGATRQVMWDNESVQVVASGGMSAAGEISGKAQLSLPSVTVKVDQLALALPTPNVNDVLAMVKKAHITVGVPDLAKAYALWQRLTPPVAGQTPLNLAGSASVTADVSRAAKTSTFTLAMKADGIAVRRGTTDLKLDKPVTVDVLASAETRPGADVMSQLAMVRVDKLLGDFGPAKVELTKPIVVSDVAAASKLLSDPKAKAGELGGAIRLTGNFANMAKLADALAGTKAGQPSVLPIAGDLTSDTELAYTGSAIGLKSKTQILSFAVLQDGKATFSEPQVDLVSNVTLDLSTQTLAMENVSLRLVKSDALSLDVKGSVKDLTGQRQLDGVVITLTPDLAKVWDIVRPLMPPDKLATVGKLLLAGKQPIVVNISGSYPSGTNVDPMKMLKMTGDFKADLIDWQQYGIKIEGLALPFSLADGVLHTAYQTPQGTKLAPPAKLNEGKLHIPDCQITMPDGRITKPEDIAKMAAAHSLMTIPANFKLVEGMKLNTVMVSMLGEKVMPLFYNPKEAAGLVDLTIVRCERLPVDGFVMSTVAGNDGVCEILASATELKIGTGGLESFYMSMRSNASGGQNAITGNIRDAKVSIAKGHVQHEMKFMLGKGEVAARGDLVMATNVYTSFVMDVPTTMVSGWVKSSSLLQYMPERVGLTFHGPASALKLDEKFLTDLISGALQKQLKSGLLGGGDKPAQGQPTTQGGNAAEKKPADAVEGLIDLFGKPKKKK